MLKLHEAIAVVLLNKPNRTASEQEIADEINKRNLYQRRDGNPVPAYQIMQRTKLAKGLYHHLFDYQSKDRIVLKNL
ncbi:MAG: hypothetical protein V2I54_06875 [Bacteroidales bacterium]|jgi:hypothetical protein|nr:hypothetical protein [Bacteroidales bacterium]